LDPRYKLTISYQKVYSPDCSVLLTLKEKLFSLFDEYARRGHYSNSSISGQIRQENDAKMMNWRTYSYFLKLLNYVLYYSLHHTKTEVILFLL